MPAKKVSQSPSPTATQETIDFPAAIAAIIDGQKVTKLEWGNPDNFGVLRNGMLMIHLDDGWHTWLVNYGDLAGTDWHIL